MVIIRKKGSQITDRVACIILAGGQGTRLFPLTRSRCKPAVGFGGRYRIIDVPISNSLNSNLRHIFVISQYFASELNQHIKETFPLDHFQGGSLTFLNPEEHLEGNIWYEGTADAVRKNLTILSQLPVEYFLILSGDQLYNMNLGAMIHFAYEKNADLTIASLPVGQTQTTRLGLLSINQNSEITAFHEKPQDSSLLKRFELSEKFIEENDIQSSDPPSFLASMGIYLFRRETLISLLQEDKREDFGKHIIPTHLKKGRSFAFLHKGYWEDIGTVSSYYEANLALTNDRPQLNLYNELLPIYAHTHFLPGAHLKETHLQKTLICDGSIIKAKKISHSIVGVRSVIQEASIIEDTILIGNQHYSNARDERSLYTIGKNCHIKKAIIDENVVIGDHVRLTNQNNVNSYDGNGVFIRNGIIVVTSHTILPNHFTL